MTNSKNTSSVNIDEIVRYYTEKVQVHGATHQGVDWSSGESQNLRFEQLSVLFKNIQSSNTVSILDYGCGYGAYFKYLENVFPHLKYAGVGYDLSPEMLFEAKRHNQNAQWISEIPSGFQCDYVVASGVFNVKLSSTSENWEKFVLNSLRTINSLATMGFSFNLLTSYSDKDKLKSHLYYANPFEVFDFCKTHFSKYVSLIHDYPLYEFTIVVRKKI